MRPNTHSLITVMDLLGAALEEASQYSERVHTSICHQLSQGASGKANARDLNPGTFPAT